MTEECYGDHSVTTWTNEKALGDLMVLLVRFTTQHVLCRRYLDTLNVNALIKGLRYFEKPIFKKNTL